jgi:hypothetical protein
MSFFLSQVRRLHRPRQTAHAVLAPLLCVLLLAAAVVHSLPAVADDSWSWPLEPAPRLVRGFEPPTSPWGPGHRGIDLAGQLGQAVLAVAPGTVVFAGQVAGRGVVVLRPTRRPDLRSTYEPVTPSVRVGETVQAATLIGSLTLVGSHCLPDACLHLGARRGDRYVDPLSLLGDLEIRLKPLDAAEVTGPGTPVPVLGPPATPPSVSRTLTIVARLVTRVWNLVHRAGVQAPPRPGLPMRGGVPGDRPIATGQS